MVSQKPAYCVSSHVYLAQSFFQVLQLALLDDQVTIIVQILHNIIVPFFVIFQNNGFHGRVTFDQDPCSRDWSLGERIAKGSSAGLPRTARGILANWAG